MFLMEKKKNHTKLIKKSPINFYGYSKALAEDHILNFLRSKKIFDNKD